MPRGEPSPVGTEKISQNGYIYIKTEEGWRLKHHLVAEKTLGRHLERDERVSFVDGDRTNLTPRNLKVVPVGHKSHSRVSAQRELQIVRRLLERLSERVIRLEEQLEAEVDTSDSE